MAIEKITNPITANFLINKVNDIIENKQDIETFGIWTYNNENKSITIINDTISYSYDSENKAVIYGKSYYKNQAIIIIE